MKVFVFTLLIVPTVVLAVAPDLTLYNAQRHGANVKFILRVIDQDGRPVSGAKISGGFQTGGNLNDNVPIRGVTDANGEYMVNGKSVGMVRCGISKDGYYSSDLLEKYPNSRCEKPVENGKWQPFGDVRDVVLKAIRNPGRNSTFPESLRSCRIPEFGKWIGFDFECGAWVAPYGKGLNSDVLLKFTAMERGMHDYKFVMDVSFTNNPYAGAYLMKKDKSSELTTVYVADSNAIYRTAFSYISEQTPGKDRHWDFLDSDSYLVFRTRTRVDKDNNLVGAHYGKILGRWLSDTEFMILSDGCFNSVENDVNIEDSTCLRYIIKNMNTRK